MPEKFDIFKDIIERTGGDIYVGVVGPVRTGKSTFIKRFMETLVLPNIEDRHDRERAIDELPQSGSGRTVSTTEPKFIPDEAVEIVVNENIVMRLRMVDCVGYAVEGALGYEEDDGPRMVMTPWYDYAIPFQEAAEIGTKKVIAEHSTIGVVVTTDGSITDIPRSAYVHAEERVIEELKEIGKPFIVILNCTNPLSQGVRDLASDLEEKYDVPVLPLDCYHLDERDINAIMEQVLFEFPVQEVQISLPLWVEELAPEHWLRKQFEEVVGQAVSNIRRLRDIELASQELSQYDFIEEVLLKTMDLGNGIAAIELMAKEQLFHQILEEIVGASIEGKHDLIRLLRDLSESKREFDQVANALREVREFGYGTVAPRVEDMVFMDPELIRQGNRFGVRLRASAASLHFIRADIETEVTPIIGSEKQSEELVKYLMDQFEEDPKKLWETNMFGKSLSDLVREGIQSKLNQMPENAQKKLRTTLERIINEGSGGLICIII